MLSAPHSSGGLRVATVVAVLVCCQPGAWAQNTNSILAYGNAGDPVFDLSAGTPVSAGGSGSILIGSWSGNEAHVAAASGQSLTLRALVASRGIDNQPLTQSSFSWTTTTLPGSSGLAVGSIFTATISFRIEGSHFAGLGASLDDYSASSRSATQLTLDVYDLDSPTHEPGAPMSKVDFSSYAGVTASQFGPSPDYPSGDGATSWAYGVNLQTTNPLAGVQNWAGNENQFRSAPGGRSASQRYDVSTGVLSLSFETLVGNRIHFEGLLTTSTACLTSGGISCEGVADFSNTFDAEVASMIPGVQFSNLTPGVFEPVPEPSSAVLMALGLWALLQRRKRV